MHTPEKVKFWQSRGQRFDPAMSSMGGADVIAGKSGVFKAVEAVNVLEYCEIGDELEQFFENNSFEGNELMITSFANIRDNVEYQSLPEVDK